MVTTSTSKSNFVNEKKEQHVVYRQQQVRLQRQKDRTTETLVSLDYCLDCHDLLPHTNINNQENRLFISLPTDSLQLNELTMLHIATKKLYFVSYITSLNIYQQIIFHKNKLNS